MASDVTPNQPLGGVKSIENSRQSWSQNAMNSVNELPAVPFTPETAGRGVVLDFAFPARPGAGPLYAESASLARPLATPGSDHMTASVGSSQPSPADPHRADTRLSLSSGAPLMPISPALWSGSEADQTSMSSAYTAPQPNHVVLHMIDASGESVYCVQSADGKFTPLSPHGAHSAALAQSMLSNPASATAPGVVPALPPQSDVPWAAPQSGAGTPPNAAPGTPPSPLSSLDVSGTLTDEFEYEPYNASTLTNRRVGSLDRVFCALHGKDRSAQNMVLVRSKRTNEFHWRCKHSSPCKSRRPDGGPLVASLQDGSYIYVADVYAAPPPAMVAAVGGSDVALSGPISLWGGPGAAPQFTLIAPGHIAVQPHMSHPPAALHAVAPYGQQHDVLACASPVQVHTQAPPPVAGGGQPAPQVYYQVLTHTAPPQQPQHLGGLTPVHITGLGAVQFASPHTYAPS